MIDFIEVFKRQRYTLDGACSLISSLNKKKTKPIQRSYKTTNDDQRYQFLYQVINKELTVSKAADKYGINYTTAKNILNIYLKEGRVGKKKIRIRKKKNLEKGAKENNSIEKPKFFISEEDQTKSKHIPHINIQEKFNDNFWSQRITEHLHD